MTLASTARGQTTQSIEFAPFSYIRAMRLKFNVKFYVNYEFGNEFLRKLELHRSINTEWVSNDGNGRAICVNRKEQKTRGYEFYEDMERMHKGTQILKGAAW